MSSNTSPDNITYPVSGDSVAPLETVFSVMATSIQNALNTRAVKSYKPADFTALAAVTGMVAGDMATVVAGSVDMEYNGTVWVQQTVAFFATTTTRDTEYAKASGVYKVALTARVNVATLGFDQVWSTLTSTWKALGGGLVPIVPTSVSGTGVSLVGAVTTLTTATGGAQINGIFNLDFDNYLCIYDFPTLSAGVSLKGLMSLAGSPDTSANYNSQLLFASAGTASGATQTAQAYWQLGAGTGVQHAGEIKLFAPAKAAPTRILGEDNAIASASAVVPTELAGYHNVATAYDGFNILPVSASNITGTMAWYGFTK